MMNKSVKINPKLLVLIFFLMLSLSFASVPLYDLFCRVTGFGGTTQFSKEKPSVIMPEIVSMRFDTNVSGNLPISFKVLKNREELYESIENFKKKFPDEKKVPRPDYWSGWSLSPNEIEFWLDGDNRIHQRLKYLKSDNKSWKKVLLSP